ncbi:hypothetical protein Pcinc_022664 [Petrolisthes cinctipes]|uniref:Uncharacterized protein n=1 Tax=Petrolisthes cinctipes TaxID=88211 RepID=A0AAE1FFV1_PETCI|nr:hypothetical protein Pcinc_022664 [Petrolisthes cinctipes]
MELNSSSGEATETHTIRVAAVVQELFPSIQKDNPTQDWLKNFLFRLSNLLQTTPQEATNEVTQRLKRHIRINSVGNPSVDLVAASMLLCHPHLHLRQFPNKNVPLMPRFLPTPLREKVSMGIFVPLGHLLYAETLMQKVAFHVLPNGKCVDPDPYPLNTNEPAPENFVALVRRPDVLRGLSTHAFTLAFRFPLLAADMHGLARHMTILMYVHGLPVAAAIDLYDSFFWEFQRQLSLMTVMPLDQFPSWLVDSVFVRYGITHPQPLVQQ